jgi:hypothetical protein
VFRSERQGAQAQCFRQEATTRHKIKKPLSSH